MIHEGQPRLTVECVVFGIDDEDLKVLVTRRDREPSRGTWWLPGGLARAGESLENTARRELERETGVARLFLEQLYTFGDGGPDPRGPIVSVAYYALIKLTDQRLAAPADRPAAWFPVWDLPP